MSGIKKSKTVSCAPSAAGPSSIPPDFELSMRMADLHQRVIKIEEAIKTILITLEENGIKKA